MVHPVKNYIKGNRRTYSIGLDIRMQYMRRKWWQGQFLSSSEMKSCEKDYIFPPMGSVWSQSLLSAEYRVVQKHDINPHLLKFTEQIFTCMSISHPNFNPFYKEIWKPNLQGQVYADLKYGSENLMMKCRMLNHPNKDAQILTVERIRRPIFLDFSNSMVC